MKRLSIGDVTITSIIERDGPWRTPQEMFPAYDPIIGKRHVAELDSEVFDPASGKMVITYQTYIVRTPRHTVLIDTCTGETKAIRRPRRNPRRRRRQCVSLQLPANHRSRSGAASRRRLSARRYVLAPADARPFALSLLRQYPLAGTACGRDRRPHAPRLAMSRARLVDDLRLGSGASRAVAAKVSYRDCRDRAICVADPFSTSDDGADRGRRCAVQVQVRAISHMSNRHLCEGSGHALVQQGRVKAK